MSQYSDEEVLIRKYLLGEFDQKQQEEVEERLLCDNAFADRLYATQDNLIDDYVFNLLPEDDRERFEKNFTLNPERRKKLLFAQAIESYVNIDNQRRREAVRHRWWEKLLLPLWEYKALSATALATVILSIFIVPKIASWLKPVNQPGQNRASIERRIAELNKRPFDENTQAQPALELTIQPALLREGGEMSKAVLTKDIKNLDLKLVLPQVRYGNYRALVRAVEGSELFAVEDLKPEPGGAQILLKIPSEFLPVADYEIELKRIADEQVEDVARYNFRVTK